MPGSPSNIDFVIRALEFCGDGVLITDASLEPPGPTILWINEGFRRISGYHPDELVGRSPRVLQGPRTERAVLDALKAALEAGDGFHGETWNYRKDGTPYRVEWDIAPVRDEAGRIEGYISIQRDVTQRYHAQERLKQALGELERSNRDLERFAYVASHDLQEPLRMMGSYAQLVERRYAESLDDQGREFLRYISDGAGRMKAMVDGLLAYSRLQRGQMNPQCVNSTEIVEAAVANLRRAIDQANAGVTYADLPEVSGDPALLTHLFQNLIDNALKYRHPERPPEVRISAARAGDGWVFAVADNGIGLPQEQAERIFQIFQRLHGPHNQPGTGLGLAVCRSIVERHGGRIWAESDGESGTVFRFSLPATEAED